MRSILERQIAVDRIRDLPAILEGIAEAVEVVNQLLVKPSGADFILIETASRRKIVGNLPPMSGVFPDYLARSTGMQVPTES